MENWLGLVEDSMVVSLRKLTKAALADFEEKPRHVWATQHASQVHNHTRALSVANIYIEPLSHTTSCTVYVGWYLAAGAYVGMSPTRGSVLC